MPQNRTSRLQRLRGDLARVDAEILGLVARRQRIASAVGRVKLRAGMPARDPSQERAVIRRARSAAQRVGLSPDLAESLLLQLMHASVCVQRRYRRAGRRSQVAA